MNKNIFYGILILFLSMSVAASAKEKQMAVVGHAEDSFTREGLNADVTIMKSDSTVVGTGKLVIGGDTYLYATGEPGETFIYKFESEGYLPVTLNFTMPKRGKLSRINMKPVLMIKKRKIRELDEVTVTTSKVKMVMKGDTIVYNADAFELSNGSMLDALISRLPGVELKDGVIKVNGQYVSSLLLNGENFFQGDPSIALQNLPAFTVKNVKVYNKEHESAYITGKAKNRKDLPLVMDVILKREYSTGFLGNLEGGYGMPGNRWMGRAFLLCFADNLRITAFGNGNNINNSTTAGTGGQWSQENKMTGENRIVKEGIDYLFHNKKTPFKFEGDVILTHDRNTTIKEISTRNFIPDGDTWERTRKNSLSKDFNLSTSHRITLQYPSFYGGIRGGLSFGNNKGNSLANSAVFSSEPEESHRVSALDSVFTGIESPELLKKLSYRYADRSNFSTRRVSGNASSTGFISLPGTMNNMNYFVYFNYRRSHFDQQNGYGIIYPHDPDQSENTDRRQDRKESSTTLNTELQYDIRNIFSNGRVSLNLNLRGGYDFKSDTDDNSWYDLFEQASSRQAILASLDPANSYRQRITDNSPWIYSGFSIWAWKDIEKELRKTSLHLSTDLILEDRIRFERLRYDSPEVLTTLDRTSNFLTPTIRLSLSGNRWFKFSNDDADWIMGARNEYKLNYKYKETGSPLSYGIDYRRSPNPLNVYLPNTSLRRSKLHEITFQWTHKGMKQTMMDLYSYVHIRPDALVQARFYDRETGVSTWMPDNISGNWESYIYFKFTKPITRNKELQFSSGTFFLHKNDVDYVSTSDVPERSKVVGNYQGEQLSLSWQHGKVFLSGTVSAELNTARSDRPNFVDLNLWYLKPTFSATVPLPGEIQLSTNLDMLNRYGFSDPNLRKAELLWNAELSRSFINGKLLVKLRAYDILGRVNPTTTLINAQAVTETFTNTLTRYVMLQLTYRFNKNPKKRDASLPSPTAL